MKSLEIFIIIIIWLMTNELFNQQDIFQVGSFLIIMKRYLYSKSVLLSSNRYIFKNDIRKYLILTYLLIGSIYILHIKESNKKLHKKTIDWGHNLLSKLFISLYKIFKTIFNNMFNIIILLLDLLLCIFYVSYNSIIFIESQYYKVLTYFILFIKKYNSKLDKMRSISKEILTFFGINITAIITFFLDKVSERGIKVMVMSFMILFGFSCVYSILISFNVLEQIFKTIEEKKQKSIDELKTLELTEIQKSEQIQQLENNSFKKEKKSIYIVLFCLIIANIINGSILYNASTNIEKTINTSNSSSIKERELDIRERELDIRERELILKEKELNK